MVSSLTTTTNKGHLQGRGGRINIYTKELSIKLSGSSELFLVIALASDDDDFPAGGVFYVRFVGADVLQGSEDGLWDWWGSWQPGTGWLVAILIGNVAQLEVLAFWGDPAEGALLVAIHITLSRGTDLVGQFEGVVEAIRTDVAVQRQNIGIVESVVGDSTRSGTGVDLGLATSVGNGGSGEAN